ncbi:MAG: TIR domain-containing protein [Gemmatimonadota bacterium]
MAKIVLSYRREDAAAATGRLYDRLREEFGPDQVFMDIDTIEPGIDFVTAIQSAIASADVVIAVIGRRWTSVTTSAGSPRIQDPDDFVRLEVGTALQRDIRVIPVLIDDAVLPNVAQLPPDLAPLLRRNAVHISHLRFHSDADRLIRSLRAMLAAGPDPSTEEKEVTGGEPALEPAIPEPSASESPRPEPPVREPALPFEALPLAASWPLLIPIPLYLLAVVLFVRDSVSPVFFFAILAAMVVGAGTVLAAARSRTPNRRAIWGPMLVLVPIPLAVLAESTGSGGAKIILPTLAHAAILFALFRPLDSRGRIITVASQVALAVGLVGFYLAAWLALPPQPGATAAIQPEAAAMAFVGQRDTRNGMAESGLYRFDFYTDEITRLDPLVTESDAARLLSWTSSREVVYVRGDDIWSVAESGRDSPRLLLETEGFWTRVGVDPDRRRLAFFDGPSGLEHRLRVYEIGGDPRTVETDQEFEVAYYSPIEWSPDGTLVAIEVDNGAGGQDVRVIDIQSGRTQLNITGPSRPWVQAPKWSGDGEWLYYWSGEQYSGGRLNRVRLDGSGHSVITESPREFSHLAGPRGGRFVFVDFGVTYEIDLRDGSVQLFLAGPENQGMVRSIQWFPDEQQFLVIKGTQRDDWRNLVDRWRETAFIGVLGDEGVPNDIGRPLF